jgi:hypothetical protein
MRIEKKTSKRTVFLFSALFCFIATSCDMIPRDDVSPIKLSGIVWKYVKDNKSVLKTRDGRVLVGPGGITLWGNYPYLVGTVNTNGVVEKFVIDLRDYSVSNSHENYVYVSVTPAMTDTTKFKSNHLINVVRTEDGEVKLLPSNLIGSGIDWGDFVTFGDLRGQWAKEGKLAELRANLEPKPEEEPKSEEESKQEDEPEQEPKQKEDGGIKQE